MIELLIILAIACLLFLLALRGRTGHPALEAMQNFAYAHRGLHGNGIPENSMAAFRASLAGGYGIELDIHLMADGNLAVIHDGSLKRTAGVDVKITDLTTEDLKNYPLEGTEEIIPTFDQVLKLYNGKAPLIIELKADGNNHAALTDAAVKAMEGYPGIWCMESFDPRCVHHLRKYHADVCRGQLSFDHFKNKDGVIPLLKFLLKHNLLNFLTLPDFVAYSFEDRKKTFTNTICRKFWKLQGVSWTIRSQADFDTAKKEALLPIFEYFTP